MTKHTLILADLNYVHPGKEWTIIPFPLNVAYIAAFLEKQLPGAFEVTIVKDPQVLLDVAARREPRIVAFSNYIWNRNLQLAFARHIKSLHPGCLTVMGGPNYNFSEREWIERFAREHKQVDFHIEGEGEVKFYNLARCALEHDFDAEAVKQASPAGVAYLDPSADRMVVNDLSTRDAWARLDDIDLDMHTGRLRDLTDIPSPYLTGLLDEFLADPNYCPIIETNRGCPYACTFCNWGDMGKSKSALFAHDRVEDELRHIATHNGSTTPYLYIGDANFGLFKRDIEFARLLRELKDTLGFPQNVYLYYAKNSSEKVVEIAAILKDMTRISLSRQTQNPEVLESIKRSNISIETFSRLAELAKSLGVESFAELIYALPGETKDSFFAGVREVMRQQVDGIHLFPAMLLDGSEMGSLASRRQYGLAGEWRTIDGCAGQFGPIAAAEAEEIITQTNALSRNDYFEIRLFHFFLTLFVDTKLYKDVEVLIGDRLLFELVEDIIEHRAQAPVPVRTLIDDFIAAAKAELQPTAPHDVTAEDVARFQSSQVKLNPLFIAKLVYDPGVRQAFHDFLRTRILALGSASDDDIVTVLRHIDESLYPFDNSTTKLVVTRFDPVAFAGRSLSRSTTVSQYISRKARVFEYVKPFTYQVFLDRMADDRPLSARVYEIILHHSHESLRQTVTWIPNAEVSAHDGRTVEPALHSGVARTRRIETEGGWVY